MKKEKAKTHTNSRTNFAHRALFRRAGSIDVAMTVSTSPQIIAPRKAYDRKARKGMTAEIMRSHGV